MGRPGIATSSSASTTTRCPPRHSSRTCCRSCVTRATCASMAPVVAIYRPAQIPDFGGRHRSLARRRATRRDRRAVRAQRRRGQELPGRRAGPCGRGPRRDLGFPPHNGLWTGCRISTSERSPGFAGNILSYRALVPDAIGTLERGIARPRTIPGVMVKFDNTARRQGIAGHVVRVEPVHLSTMAGGRGGAVAHRDSTTGWCSSTPGTNGPKARCSSRATGTGRRTSWPSATSPTGYLGAAVASRRAYRRLRRTSRSHNASYARATTSQT